jgi:Ca-activated chloride channel homolog
MNRTFLFALCSLCLCGFNARAAKPEWPRLYNQGVTAYESNDFATASQQFEQSLASPNRDLQERAQYNLGNVYYRQGEADQKQAQQLWEKAIKQYEGACALNPKDDDAKFNRDFVKKKLEELKKQQQEQQQQKQQQKDQQKQDQQKQGQQQQNQKQDKQQQRQDQQNQQQNKQQQDKEKQQQQQQQKQDQQKKDQGKENQKDQEKGKEQQQQPQPSPSDQLEKQEAKAMLDNLRENEQNWNFFPEAQMKDLKEKDPPAKDW